MNGFVAEKIPDECAESLVSAIITDAVYRYARALLNLKKYEHPKNNHEKQILNHANFTVNEIEVFFRGQWFASLAEYMNLNISGDKIIKMIKRSPKKFCNEHGGRRKKSYAAN